jgi:nucleoside-diphosphate-sugar epimerase
MLVTNTIQACLEGKNLPMTPGEQARDFLYVDDLIEGIITATTKEGCVGEIINIGSGSQTKIKDVVLMINRLCDNPIAIEFGAQSYRPDENMEYWLDITKARQLIGFQLHTTLEQGLMQTIAWYKDHSTFLT